MRKQDDLMLRVQEKLEKLERLKREISKQSNQQTISSLDRARRPALDALIEKIHQLREKKTAKKIDLSLTKYHAQELLKLLEQEPNNPMFVRAYVEVRTILNSPPLRDIEANPPSDK